MEHSTAILEDAKSAIEAAVESHAQDPAPKDQADKDTGTMDDHSNKYDRRKRKGNFPESSMHHGGRGGRGNNKRYKKGDMGRGEYL